ncbi:gliding motility-associated C-terminal domain-containing protein [Mariniflexile ostreae]|uniref:Gliding motility-associated C-terminal domain-containing protein n=1 Tax=Mariniflexile ostreae TaxID=1520892 RepID=A0ABV5FCY6_9FLAO
MKSIFRLLLLLSLVVFYPTQVNAEGSKDLYPSGASGHRAYLISHNPESQVNGWPFLSRGTHFVYARTNEVITAASSAQGIGNGLIVLIAPDGTTYTSVQGSSIGRIANRTEELAGPNAPGGYVPFSQVVGPGQAGIWQVDFIATRTVPSFNQKGASGLANANWSEQNDESSAILAWDVTVFDTADNALSGRVYANLLAQYVGGPYYGIMYVLTNDGYVYKVNNNGQYGVGFMSFSNNKGLTTGTGDNATPSYKSLNDFGSGVPTKDPREPDGLYSITHKMFYSFPDNTMPAVANMPGRTIWLNPQKVIPTVTNVEFIGVEGAQHQMSQKGGFIEFEANMSGTYKIVINRDGGFVERILTGTAQVGTNSVLWDGRDGAGNPLLEGTAQISVNVRLQGAEVHFPFIDLEFNANGLIIEQLNDDGSVKSDIVYWDDSDIVSTSNAPSNPTVNGNDGAGISSNINGHIWSGNYGNDKVMDTWTYILGDSYSISKNIEVALVDLAILNIESITPITEITPGESITYSVPVINYGPSSAKNAPFHFKVPNGFSIENLSDVIYSLTCQDAAVNNLSIDADGNINALLDIPNGCRVNFNITGKVGATLVCNPIVVEASIMRPHDVTDIDATNPDPLTPPTDPHLECLNGTTTEACNNIKYNDAIVVSPAVPISNGNKLGCEGETLMATASVPSGSTILWYDAPSGGNVVANPQLDTLGTVRYYAETNNGGCTSAQRTEVILSIEGKPNLTINDPLPVCEPTAVDLTLAEITDGSGPMLEFSYYTDASATTPLVGPENINVSGTYYIKGTNIITGCSDIKPVQVEIMGRPELLIGQPTCSGGNGSITILEPLGSDYEYSIDGVNYQASVTFVDVIPGTYHVTAKDTRTNCESLAEVATIDNSPAPPTPSVVQPNCSDATGTISLPLYAGANYSINGGATFVTNNIFNGLSSGVYDVIIRDSSNCTTAPVQVTIEPASAALQAPKSGGNQYGCATIANIPTLTATASVGMGETLIWYDAPSGGNVVSNPSLNAIGEIVYYAEGSMGNCTSTRTPVFLRIDISPEIDNLVDQNSCGPYTFPAITGTNLSGNEAYYTGVNGSGTRYVPGDQIADSGVHNLFIYDELISVEECPVALDILTNTTEDPAKYQTMRSYIYPGQIDQMFWSGNASVDILHNYPGTVPPGSGTNSIVHNSITGDIQLPGIENCTLAGDSVELTISVDVENLGPGVVRSSYVGGLFVIDKATKTTIGGRQNFPVIAPGATRTVTAIRTVSHADIVAGNIAVIIQIESHQDGHAKSWQLSNFQLAYDFSAVGQAVCADEPTFELTIQDIVTAGEIAGEFTQNETICSGETPNGLISTVSGTGSGTISYIWEASTTDSQTGFTEIIGANGESYSPTSLSETTFYRRITKSTLNGFDCLSEPTPVVTITVNPQIVNNTISEAQTVCNGETPDLIVGSTPSGGNGAYVYEWEQSVDNGLTWTMAVGLSDEKDYAPGALIQETLYRRNVTDGVCSANISNEVKISIADFPIGYDDTIDNLDCTGSFTYDLAANSMDIANGGNGVAGIYSWTPMPNMNVIGATSGTGQTILSQTLINISSTEQQVRYVIEGKSETVPSCSSRFYITVNVPVCSSMSIDKVADINTVDAVDDIINYTITVSNTGNANQTNVIVNDHLVGGNLMGFTGDNGNDVLEAGEVWVYTTTYTVLENDLNNFGNPIQGSGLIRNTVSVVSDQIPTAITATEDVMITEDPSLRAVKTASITDNGDGILGAGDTIAYTITVANTGNVTLGGINLADTFTDAHGAVLALTTEPAFKGADQGSAEGTLLVGETATYIATYVIDQSAVDAGGVANSVVASGDSPAGTRVSDTSDNGDDTDGNTEDDTTVTNFTEDPSLRAVKTASITDNGDGVLGTGDAIAYTITVANTGNVTLGGITLADTFTDAHGAVLALTTEPAFKGADQGSAEGTLLVGETATYIATYVIEQSAVDASGVANSVVASGDSPAGTRVSDTSDNGDDTDGNTEDDSTQVVFEHYPEITLVKTSELKAGGSLGDIITYAFTATNSGNVTLTNVVVDDLLTNTINLSIQPSTLAPGESGIATATYIITQLDMIEGSVVNSAFVKGLDPNSNEVEDISGTEIDNDDPTTTYVIKKDPETLDDSAETLIGQPVNIPIMENDIAYDTYLVPETIEILQGPSYGTITIDANGMVVYTPTPGIKFTGQDNFTYRIKDAYESWSNVATVTITIKGLFFPNAISPNGDGDNDAFEIIGIEYYKDAEVLIFNRWGNEVYRNSNYKNGNNKFSGEGLNNGTYYYVVNLTNEKGSVENYKGWLFIQR